MGVVAFDYALWADRYPELAATVPQPQAEAYFAEAGLYCDNTPASPVQDETVRAVLLGMVVAHIAALAKQTGVGRMAEMQQGSVQMKSENRYPPGTVQWWQQSRYGAAFWAASQRYRQFFYVEVP